MTAPDPSLAIFIGAGCLTSFCAGAIITYLAVHWGLDRQAEVDRVRKDAAVEAGLAVVEELERRTSGEQPAVDADLDVPGFMAHSGYRPPVRPSVGRVSD